MKTRSHSDIILTGYNIYIKPTYVVTMPEFSGGNGSRSQKQIDNEENLKDNSHKGSLSKKAMSKLRNAINWLVVSSKVKRVYSKRDKKNFFFKVNFVTLTVPPQSGGLVSEKLFKKALHAWLIYANKYFYLKNYVWKIEAHEDGRLHVHLCTDTFIHVRKLRQSWNRTLDNNGLLDLHFQKFGNKDPNSTDIHATRKVDDLAAYMCEYMVKKPFLGEGYSGRIWSCNYELSHKNSCSVNVDPHEMAECMASLCDKQIRYSNIESPPDSLGNRKKIGEIFFVDTHCWSKIIKGKIKKEYDEHRFYIRSGCPKPPRDYFEIDYFSEQTIAKYNGKNVKPLKTEICKTEIAIPKIGSTQLDLVF